MVAYCDAAIALSDMSPNMLRSFTKDWSRWTASERLTVKIVGLGLLAFLAAQIGSHLV